VVAIVLWGGIHDGKVLEHHNGYPDEVYVFRPNIPWAQLLDNLPGSQEIGYARLAYGRTHNLDHKGDVVYRFLGERVQ
jgi:hypothetical protein